MSTRRKRPRCFQCKRRPAKALAGLPGAYGQVEAFCSYQCAAKKAMEPFLCYCFWPCLKCGMWTDEHTNQCGECGHVEPTEENR